MTTATLENVSLDATVPTEDETEEIVEEEIKPNIVRIFIYSAVHLSRNIMYHITNSLKLY